MSALPQDDRDDLETTDREAERSARYVVPLLPGRARRVWDMDSWALPVPRRLRRLVRDGRTWREAVHAAIQRYQPPVMGMAERRARQGEYETFLRTLMYLGPDSDAFARLVLRLFPVARCRFKGCRQPYLRYNAQVLHCSDACRRGACVPETGPVAFPFEDACRRCGEPLAGDRRRYCGEGCARQAGNALKAARERAQRAAEGRSLPPPLPACAICGGPLTGRRLRYCREACRRVAGNDARAARKLVAARAREAVRS